jgi:hypothetical protein
MGSMTDCSGAIRIGSHVCVRDDDGEAEFRIVDPAEAESWKSCDFGSMSCSGRWDRANITTARRSGVD